MTEGRVLPVIPKTLPLSNLNLPRTLKILSMPLKIIRLTTSWSPALAPNLFDPPMTESLRSVVVTMEGLLAVTGIRHLTLPMIRPSVIFLGRRHLETKPLTTALLSLGPPVLLPKTPIRLLETARPPKTLSCLRYAP